MKFVPIPSGELEGTAPVWLPFLEKIAKRCRCHTQQLMARVASGEVHLFVVWDINTKEAVAFAGSRLVLRGDGHVGELIWMTGKGRHRWQDLVDELESYHRDHLGCSGFWALARPGWGPLLKSKGYRMTHVQYEKDF